MEMKDKSLQSLRLTILLIFTIMISFGFAEGDKTGKTLNKGKTTYQLSKTSISGKQGDAYRLNINNINVPLNNKGIIAAVNIDNSSGGIFAGNVFLFSGGFFLSGTTNGEPWANAVASASLVENYVPGLAVPNGQNDPRAVLYVLNNEDPPFGQSWQDWKDAVDMGADFYDGDGDGIYNPVDLNGDGLWNPDEDSPDLLGDETVWCVYSDGQPLAQRDRFSGIRPQGIEVRQTVFAFASKGAIGNILFVRYRLKNTGLLADTLKDVYFGAWADPDLGDYNDDLVGVDTTRNAGYIYNDGSDIQYGTNPPCFIIDFFSGPISYIPGETFTDVNSNGLYDEGIDIPLDTAYSVRGQRIGVKFFPGAKNLGVSSFIHYQQSDPDLGDPNTHIEARNYMLGLDRKGKVPDPCTWALGEVLGGVDCSLVNPKFWYSGNPVTEVGWLNNVPTDQRQMQNTGPFRLIKDQEVEIVVAYVVGQGTDEKSSITEALRIDDGAQFVFDNNFRSPSPGPAIVPTVETGEGFIDLIWNTSSQVNFVNKTGQYDLRFEGYNVYAYKTNSTQDLVSLQQNSKLYKSYHLANFINNVYNESGLGQLELLFTATADSLSPAVYSDPNEGEIRLRIRQDPFTNEPLVKGKPYYFAVTGYYLNYDALRYRNAPENPDSFGVKGDYFISKQALVGVSENIPKITIVTLGENLYNPPLDLVNANHLSGYSNSELKYDVYNKDLLTGDKYKLTFIIDDASTNYRSLWKLENSTKGTILIDSVNQYLLGKEEIAIPSLQTEGFIVRLSSEPPVLGNLQLQLEKDWVDEDFTIYYYTSNDIPAANKPTVNNTPPDLPSFSQGNFINANQIRRVVLKFGEQGKAYRYLNGYIGNFAATRRLDYYFAEAVTTNDTSGGRGTPGKFGQGFVDVPFTAWVEDFVYGETRQLAIGFIETAPNTIPQEVVGNPDGVWDPGTQLSRTREYIVIFNSTYDPSGNQVKYKGGTYIGAAVPWANLRGYTVPQDANLSEEDKLIAKSSFFDALYVIGIQRANNNDSYSTGDQIIMPVSNYPYTPADVFEFTTKKEGQLTAEEEKELFDKVTVFPNPLFGFNVATSYTNSASDDPFVTFSNLPEDVTIKIYSLSGIHIRTLTQNDKSSPTSPFLRWNLQNESGLRVASGMYLVVVSSPKYGDKVLKFGIVMPQKQLLKY